MDSNKVPELKIATKDDEQDKMKTLYMEHKKQADLIASQCCFTDIAVSDKAHQACQTIDMLFEEFTKELALILPNQFRTVNVLENLELACLWAKKSICTYDHALTLQKEKNGAATNQN